MRHQWRYEHSRALLRTARLIVYVRHAVIAGARLCYRGHPDHWHDTAAGLHPFVAIVVIAAAFGYVAGSTTSVLTQNFGSGFGAMMYSPGLVIIAAAFISGLAETTRASDRLAAKLLDWQKRWPWLSSDKIAACLGLIAGLGASPASAFAVLSPLFRPLRRRPRRKSATAARSRWRWRFRRATVLSGSPRYRSRPPPSSAPNGAALRCSACRSRLCSRSSPRSLRE